MVRWRGIPRRPGIAGKGKGGRERKAGVRAAGGGEEEEVSWRCGKLGGG